MRPEPIGVEGSRAASCDANDEAVAQTVSAASPNPGLNTGMVLEFAPRETPESNKDSDDEIRAYNGTADQPRALLLSELVPSLTWAGFTGRTSAQ